MKIGKKKSNKKLEDKKHVLSNTESFEYLIDHLLKIIP